jgi:hypothetical protein
MSWYAAHLLMSVRVKDGPQDRIPLWENIVLFQAESEDEAFAKAEQRGRVGEGDEDGSFRWGGKPARWVFAGVHKLTEFQDPDERPCDGTEVSYIEMEAGSEAEIENLLNGEPATIRLVDRFGVTPTGQ